jgi:hypothetical protein
MGQYAGIDDAVTAAFADSCLGNPPWLAHLGDCSPWSFSHLDDFHLDDFLKGPNRNQRVGGIGENWGAHIGT